MKNLPEIISYLLDWIFYHLIQNTACNCALWNMLYQSPIILGYEGSNTI